MNHRDSGWGALASPSTEGLLIPQRTRLYRPRRIDSVQVWIGRMGGSQREQAIRAVPRRYHLRPMCGMRSSPSSSRTSTTRICFWVRASASRPSGRAGTSLPERPQRRASHASRPGSRTSAATWSAWTCPRSSSTATTIASCLWPRRESEGRAHQWGSPRGHQGRRALHHLDPRRRGECRATRLPRVTRIRRRARSTSECVPTTRRGTMQWRSRARPTAIASTAPRSRT